MKKRLILLAALLVALALTACGGGRGGEGSAHPYRWRAADGGLELTVRNPPEEGFVWQADGSGDGAVQVERQDGGTGESAAFSVTVPGPGGGTAVISCRREDAPHDVSFQLTLSVQISRQGKPEVVRTDFLELPPAGTAGEEGKPSCTWYTDTDGTLCVYLDGGSGWTALGGDEAAVSVSGPELEEDGCTYRLSGLSAGETSLTLYDLSMDYGFRLALSAAEDGGVSVTDGEAGSFPVPPGQIPGMKAAEELVGALALPEDVRALSCRTGSWYGDGPADYARLRLRSGGADWQLVASRRFSTQELAALSYGGGDGAEQTGRTAGAFPAVLYATEKEQTVFWTDGQGRSFALSTLSAPEDGGEALLALAERLADAQEKGA